jgi:hypothetical protein
MFTMKKVFLFLWFIILFTSACKQKLLEGRYYTQNNMLEIALLPNERFAFQILSSASHKTKYLSGKAFLVKDNQYYYEDEKHQLLFEFEENHVKISHIEGDKHTKPYEGTYLFINPDRLHEEIQSNTTRASYQK